MVELPIGSTPIDFAYRIHSKVGDTTVGAIVNDQIVPLSYELQNDDVVNIKTNQGATPNKDWLNIAKTNQAKNKIKAYFSKKDKEGYIEKGKSILEKELRKRKLAFGEVLTSEAIDKLIKDLKLKDLDDIYLALGSLRYTASYIINLINNDKHNVEDALLERKRDLPKINYKGDILVEGQSNIMVNIAKCCMPVKGDEIIGYITKGQGISVHKKECPNIPQDSERTIDVAWNMDSNNYYYTNIYVTIKDNKDILAEVITEVGKKNSLVRSCKTIQKNDNLVYELNIRIADKDELEKICNGILKLSDVLEVNKSL